MTTQYWKPKPINPSDDWISPLLKASLLVSGVGWIVYGIFAFAFDDISVIPDAVQSWLVVIGSALIVAGAEMNTAPTSVAVFRKIGTGKRTTLDTCALIASFVGSVLSALITFSIRQTLFADSTWRTFALGWGPLVAGIAIAADYYAASAELGLLKSDYEQELEQWLKDEQEWNEAHGIVTVDRSNWREATIKDARRLAQSLNGEREHVTGDNLQDWFDRVNLKVPRQSESTKARWAEVLQSAE